MGARELIFDLRKSGFVIMVMESTIKIAPAEKITGELKETIRQNKPEILAELRQEVRRQKAIAMLNEAPPLERAILTDANTDPNYVILAIALRDKAVGELRIYKANYDPFLLIRLTDLHGTLH